jgi:hypothetical protein
VSSLALNFFMKSLNFIRREFPFPYRSRAEERCSTSIKASPAFSRRYELVHAAKLLPSSFPVRMQGRRVATNLSHRGPLSAALAKCESPVAVHRPFLHAKQQTNTPLG